MISLPIVIAWSVFPHPQAKVMIACVHVFACIYSQCIHRLSTGGAGSTTDEVDKSLRNPAGREEGSGYITKEIFWVTGQERSGRRERYLPQ